MRGLNALPLDDDVIDRIFSFLPDYNTLRATILSSKSFHNIFRLHPNSIIRAVSYNVTGPALPSAIRLLRYSIPQPNKQTSSSDASLLTWNEDDCISPISHEECQQLARNAKVVNALEDLFSFRHKDRASLQSVLNSMESWRLRRAMYRLMLLSKIFPVDIDSDESDNEDEDEDQDQDQDEANASVPHKIMEARHERQEYLSEFPNDDLYQLQSAASFLVDIAQWAGVAEGSGQAFDPSFFRGLVISRGPTSVLEAYRKKSQMSLWTLGEHLPFLGYLSTPLSNIWEERKTKPPPDDGTHWSSIIDHVKVDQDTCSRCNNVHGFNLWNHTNWEYLRGFSTSLSPNYLWSLAKGNLSRNAVDNADARTEFHSPTFTYTQFFNEVHRIKTSEYSSWDKQDWLCEPCIVELVRSHLHLWFLERKRESGSTIQEDCWYGYDCRTQTHSLHHAYKRNHLCGPTR